jgi:hypothetical protein
MKTIVLHGQIIQVLKEGEAGARVTDLCHKYGISNPPTSTERINTPG